MPKCKRSFKLKVVRYTAGNRRPRTDYVDVTPVPLQSGNSGCVNKSPGSAEPVNITESTNDAKQDNDSLVPPVGKHQQITCDEIDTWRSLEDLFLQVKMGLQVPLKSKCITCDSLVEEPIRCLDCGHNAVFCKNCES